MCWKPFYLTKCVIFIVGYNWDKFINLNNFNNYEKFGKSLQSFNQEPRWSWLMKKVHPKILWNCPLNVAWGWPIFFLIKELSSLLNHTWNSFSNIDSHVPKYSTVLRFTQVFPLGYSANTVGCILQRFLVLFTVSADTRSEYFLTIYLIPHMGRNRSISFCVFREAHKFHSA
jgi:hypothetical protein